MRISFLSLPLLGVLAGCAATLTTPEADSKNRVVDIVNTTDRAVNFYALSAERRGVFRARFAENVVRADYYRVVNFDDGKGTCRFDFIAEFPDGRELSLPGFDTCAEVSWVIREEDLP